MYGLICDEFLMNVFPFCLTSIAFPLMLKHQRCRCGNNCCVGGAAVIQSEPSAIAVCMTFFNVLLQD